MRRKHQINQRAAHFNNFQLTESMDTVDCTCTAPAEVNLTTRKYGERGTIRTQPERINGYCRCTVPAEVTLPRERPVHVERPEGNRTESKDIVDCTALTVLNHVNDGCCRRE